MHGGVSSGYQPYHLLTGLLCTHGHEITFTGSMRLAAYYPSRLPSVGFSAAVHGGNDVEQLANPEDDASGTARVDAPILEATSGTGQASGSAP